MTSIKQKIIDILPFELSRQTRRDTMVMFKLLLPVIAIVGIAVNFHEFVINAVRVNIAINGLIIAAASYGVALIVIRMVSAMIDFRVIERFGHEAAAGAEMHKLLEEPWLKRRYVRHYLGHIAETGGTLASQLDQNAIESELHALHTEYETKMELPQFLVGFMIAMGLLGTFIGLLETLTGIAGMLDNMGGGGDVSAQFTALVGELKKPLAGMGIAFSASMFGLVTSLMLAIMMISLRRFVSRVVSLARNVMHELIKLSRPSESSQTLGAMLTGESTETTNRSQNAAIMVANRIDTLIKKLELIFNSFEASIQANQKLNDLLGFGPRMKETGEKTLEELKMITNGQADQQRLLQQIFDINGDIARVGGSVLEGQRQGQAELTTSIRSLSEGLSRVADINVGTGEKTLDSLKLIFSGHTEQQRLLQRIIDVNGDVIRVGENVVEGQRQGQSDLALSLRSLTEGLSRVVEVNAGTGEKTLEGFKSLSAGQIEQQRLSQKIVDISTDLLRVSGTVLDTQRQAQTELGASFKGVGEHFSKIQEINIGSGRHMFDIKEKFAKLQASLGMVEQISSGIGHQSLLVETLIEEVRQAQQRLAAMHAEFRNALPR